MRCRRWKGRRRDHKRRAERRARVFILRVLSVPLHLPTSLSLPAVNSHPHLSHSTLSTMNAALLQQIQRKYSSPVHSAALTLSQRARVSRRLRSTTGPRRRWPATWAVLPLPVPAPVLVPMPHLARQRPPCRVGMTRRHSSQDSLPVACPR